jgi:Helix-turn-helix domain
MIGALQRNWHAFRQMTRSVTPMSYTIGEAARATGRSKPTISRAIKSGLISASRNDDGSYVIDPAELHRVFPPVERAGNSEPEMTRSDPPALQREIEVLRQFIASQDETISDLRHRLDQADEERRAAQAQVAALLTDSRSQRRRWWWQWRR